MVDVPVNKDVLIWARKERGLSEERAAKILKMAGADFAALELGTKLPSLGLLELMARQYKFPLAALLMPAPLAEATRRPADFRTHRGKEPVYDENLLVALDAVHSQLELLTEVRESHGDLFSAPQIRTYAIKQSAETVANEERKLIAPRIEDQFAWPTPAQAFRYWRAIIERAGAFVYVMNLGPESLCRGFSIYDERQVPVLVINGDESEGPARTFTMLHEYAHLLIQQPGISDQNRTNAIERWCNQFAAYFLMPKDRFVQEAMKIEEKRRWSDAALKELGDLFKVSMSAVALHLEETGIARAGFYEKKLEEWRKRKPGKGFSLMSFAERQVNRLGVRHTSIVLDALDSGFVNLLDAVEMTNVNPQHFPELREVVKERQVQYGGVR